MILALLALTLALEENGAKFVAANRQEAAARLINRIHSHKNIINKLREEEQVPPQQPNEPKQANPEETKQEAPLKPENSKFENPSKPDNTKEEVLPKPERTKYVNPNKPEIPFVPRQTYNKDQTHVPRQTYNKDQTHAPHQTYNKDQTYAHQPHQTYNKDQPYRTHKAYPTNNDHKDKDKDKNKNIGLIIKDDCEDASGYEFCVKPLEVSSFDLSKVSKKVKEFKIVLTQSLTKEQTFDFSKLNRKIRLVIESLDLESQHDFTIKIVNVEFKEITLNRISLYFDTSIASYFQVKNLEFNTVFVKNPCNSVIISNLGNFKGTEEQKYCFREKTIEQAPPTKLELKVDSVEKCNKKQKGNNYKKSKKLQVCITPEDVNSYDFSQRSSLVNYEISIDQELSDDQAFNFSTIPRPSNVVINSHSHTQYTLDLSALGNNVSSLTIKNVNLSFKKSSNNVFNVSKLVLSHLKGLQESEDIDISSVKNLDFDRSNYYKAFKGTGGPRNSVAVSVDPEVTIDSITVTDEGINIADDENNQSAVNLDAKEIVIKVGKNEKTINIKKPNGINISKRITFDGSVSINASHGVDIGFKSNDENATFNLTYPTHEVPVSIFSHGRLHINTTGKNQSFVKIKKIISDDTNATTIVVRRHVKRIAFEKISANNLEVSQEEPEETTSSRSLKAEEPLTIEADELIVPDFTESVFDKPIIIKKSLKIGVLGQLTAPSIQFDPEAVVEVTYYDGLMFPIIVDTEEEVVEIPKSITLVKSGYLDDIIKTPRIFNILKINETKFESVDLIDTNGKYVKKFDNGTLIAVFENIVAVEDVEESEKASDKKSNSALIIGIVVACVVVIIIIAIVTYCKVCKPKNKSSSSEGNHNYVKSQL